MSIKIGFDNPVLRNNTERLALQVAEFEEYCTRTGEKIQRLRNELPILSHWGAQDRERIISELVAATLDAKIQLSPRSTSLETQLSNISTIGEQIGSDPADTTECQNLRARVVSSASLLREQREASKKELAPAHSWKDWLFQGYSPAKFDHLACQVTTKKRVVLEFPTTTSIDQSSS